MMYDVEAARRMGEAIKRDHDLWLTGAGAILSPTQGVAAADRLLAACAEIERLLHRCTFPDCVDGERPARCGQCGDALEAERLRSLLTEAEDSLERLKAEVSRRPGAPLMRYRQWINNTLARIREQKS